MDTYKAITSRRTIRLFDQKPLPSSLLEQILNAGRIAPSAANRQVLEFVMIKEPANREKLFGHLKWGGYVTPKRTPDESNRPTAYIVILIHTNEVTSTNASDAAAAIENMILTAWNENIGSCWIGSVDREKVQAELSIPNEYQIFDVLALGYPAENPTEEELTDSIKYWLDENNQLHVPKRRLSDILHYENF